MKRIWLYTDNTGKEKNFLHFCSYSSNSFYSEHSKRSKNAATFPVHCLRNHRDIMIQGTFYPSIGTLLGWNILETRSSLYSWEISSKKGKLLSPEVVRKITALPETGTKYKTNTGDSFHEKKSLEGRRKRPL